MKNRINITVATDINTQGGIGTVLQVLKQQGFFKQTNNILITSHKISPKFKRLNMMLTFAGCLLRIVYYGLFFKINITHIHLSSRGSYSRKSIVVKLAKFFNARIIIHLHGSEFVEFYRDESSKRKQKKIRATLNSADKLIVLSKSWKIWAETLIDDPQKLMIVYNMMAKSKIERQAQPQQNILFLGRLGHRKGVGDLIKAYHQIIVDFPNSCLQLGGDGDVEKYQHQVSELDMSANVEFLGWVSGADKFDYLSNAYMYILPSYNEGFPMGVIEAMSVGLPILASTAGGIPDAITDGKQGLLIEAGNVDALANGLSDLLQNTAKAARLGQAAKLKFENNFSPDIIIPQLLAIYDELSE
ncbi:MAG: glycosyltransferase family 4 protein [Alphaproteobacteria bacterium]|nr:glycosyltransferase family 4 protein [Alphaproteobacteria bacterium]